MSLMSSAVFSPTILLKLVLCSLKGHQLALQERREGKEIWRSCSHSERRGRSGGKKENPQDCWLCWEDTKAISIIDEKKFSVILISFIPMLLKGQERSLEKGRKTRSITGTLCWRSCSIFNSAFDSGGESIYSEMMSERESKIWGFQYHSKGTEENNVCYRSSKDLYRSWNFKERKPWLGMKMILALIGIYH